MSQDDKHVLYRAAKKILKPLVRLLMRFEVSYAELAELAREVFVEVAYEEFSIPGRKTTYSRVAVLTGLSRKEVVRLNKLRESGELIEKVRPNRALRVINGWLNDPDFMDENNSPRILPVNGEIGSFRVLVERYSGDITIGALLDELSRLGMIKQPDEETVQLMTQGYIPAQDDMEKLDVLSMCAADLMNSGSHNLLQKNEPPRYQRQVAYHDLPEKSALEFQAYSNKRSSDLIQDFNRYLNQKKKSTRKNNPDFDEDMKRVRVGVGIYYFQENNIKEDSHSESESTEK